MADYSSFSVLHSNGWESDNLGKSHKGGAAFTNNEISQKANSLGKWICYVGVFAGDFSKPVTFFSPEGKVYEGEYLVDPYTGDSEVILPPEVLGLPDGWDFSL